MGAIFEGVGVSMGSLIGGLLFESVSARTTFEIFGIGAFILFVVHVCVQMYLQRNGSTDENGKGRVSSASASASASVSAAGPTPSSVESAKPKEIANKDADGFRDVDLS